MAAFKGGALQIRDARPEELDDISRVIRDAYLEYKVLIPPEVWNEYLQNIMDVRSRLDVADLIVAEIEGRVAGAVTLYLEASRSDQEGWPAGWAGIRILAVDPSHRARGIGRALMQECLRRCRARGISTIGLHTTEAMDVARRMYERMGFVRVREFDFRPDPGHVVMAYRLDL